MPRPRALCAALALTLACSPSPERLGEQPGEPTEPGPSEPEPEPEEPAEPFDPFEGGSVTIGTWCGSGQPQTHMVFTQAPGGCEAHARLLAGEPVEGPSAVLVIPTLSGPTQFAAPGEVCLDGDCGSRDFEVEIDALGPAGALGRWSADVRPPLAGRLQATVCAYDQALPGAEPVLVPNLRIDGIIMNQGVDVPLLQMGSPTRSRAIPVIAGRPGLLRVLVTPEAGYLPQDVNGELQIDHGDGSTPTTLVERRRVTRASLLESRGTVFDFTLGAEAVRPESELSIRLLSDQTCPRPEGDGSAARVERLAFEARSPGPFRVVLVPIRYGADDSNREPDLSEEQLERYRDRLFGMFPTPELDLEVRETVTWPNAVLPNGQGWANLLQAVLNLRAQDDAPPNVYYYGIFAPAESFRRYCGRGCVAGLGPLPGPMDNYGRGAIGLGFGGESSANTCVHELGHATGRSHAPCQVRDADPNFPYPDGRIGVWGYDITSGALRSPSGHSDVMSYCDPVWISDYNFGALFARLEFVNRVRSRAFGAPSSWRSLALAAEGPSWGEPVKLEVPPAGDRIFVRYRDLAGRVVGEEEAAWLGLDHLDDAIVLMAEPPEGTFAVEVDGQVVLYPNP